MGHEYSTFTFFYCLYVKKQYLGLIAKHNLNTIYSYEIDMKMAGKMKKISDGDISSCILSETRKELTALCDTSVRHEGGATSMNFSYSPSVLRDCPRKSVDPASGQGLP